MIGAGGRATSAHYPSLKALKGVEMVAVSELSEQRMADAAERFGIQAQYSDYRQMIEKEKPDAVYAIMPPHHLYDIAATVMEMGCHLFVEETPRDDNRTDPADGADCAEAKRAYRRDLPEAVRARHPVREGTLREARGRSQRRGHVLQECRGRRALLQGSDRLSSRPDRHSRRGHATFICAAARWSPWPATSGGRAPHIPIYILLW